MNRHTGRRAPPPPKSRSDLQERILAAGSVRASLDLFDAFEPQLVSHEMRQEVARARAIFAAELSPPGTPPDSHHPERRRIRAEVLSHTRARESLRTRARDVHAPDELFTWLRVLQADDAIAEATERLFGAGPLEGRADLASVRAMVEGFAPADRIAERARVGLLAGTIDDRGEACRLVARAFVAADRPRARIRWLLRAVDEASDDPAAYERLAGAYLAQGRSLEAFAVHTVALRLQPENADLWRTRALLAGWHALPEIEAESLERVVLLEEDPVARRRLLELWRFLGLPVRGIPHAMALANESGRAEDFEVPVALALEAGEVETAFELLRRIADRTGDVVWRERIVTLAQQDMRVDAAIAELRALREWAPEDPSYDARLEGVYRVRGRRAELAELLAERARRGVPDPDGARERELLGLWASLGRHDAIRGHLRAQLAAVDDPIRLLARAGDYEAAGVDGAFARARELLLAEPADPDRFDAALAALDPHRERDGAGALIETLALRVPSHPPARRELLVRLDAHATPDASARAAEALAARLPEDAEVTRAWVARASWAGRLEDEIRARTALVELVPDDATNRATLADLLEYARRPEEAVEHWRVLAEAEGPLSEAASRLFRALFDAGRVDEALVWLERRAADPNATLEDRLQIGEHLFAVAQHDRALRFFEAALDEVPDHPRALLRVGQIRSWTDDPRGAIPFLARRLEVSDDRLGEVLFLLGEAEWAIGEEESALARHRRALTELEGLETTLGVAMRARVLVRLGRHDEAIAAFESLLATAGEHPDLYLDFADALLVADRIGRAREMVENARRLDPGDVRMHRVDGQLLIREGRYEDALAALLAARDAGGPTAGLASNLAYAYELLGEWNEAAAAYDRSLDLRPDNVEVARAYDAMRARVASRGALEVEASYVGDDTTIRGRSVFDAWVVDDRVRVRAVLSDAVYRGRAAAVANGTTAVEESVLSFELEGAWRFHRRHEAALGVTGRRGAGDGAGVFGELRWNHVQPLTLLRARLHANELLDRPAAAPGLEGRSSGARVEGYRELGRRFWTSGAAEWARLTIEHPSDGEVASDKAEVRADVGYRILLDDPKLSAWGSVTSWRLLGDAEIADAIPVGETFDYATLTSRVESSAGLDGLTASVEVSFGQELREGRRVWSADVGLRYRPSADVEARLGARFGSTVGRALDDDTGSVRFSLVMRW